MPAVGIVGSPAGPATARPPCLGAAESMLAAAGPENTSRAVVEDAVARAARRVSGESFKSWKRRCSLALARTDRKHRHGEPGAPVVLDAPVRDSWGQNRLREALC